MSLELLRMGFRENRCNYIVIPGFFTNHTDALRDQVDAAAFSTFDEPDRGRYEHNSELAIPALFEDLRAIAHQISDRPVRCDRVRWLRLRHRDYQMIKDDAHDRPPTAHMEVTFDFSPVISGQAEIVYTDGHESWVVPQLPGTVAVVAREPWLFRYQRYLNAALADVVLYRLRLSLSYVENAASEPATSG